MQTSKRSISYLGILIHYWRLTIVEWKHDEGAIEKCLGNSFLVNFILINMVFYMIYSFYLKESYIDWTTSDKHSCWQRDSEKKDIYWLDGMWFIS
jgi:hypothetical protein